MHFKHLKQSETGRPNPSFKQVPPGETVNFDGNDIAMVPNCQYSLVAQYRFKHGFYLAEELTGVSKFYFTRENTGQMNQDRYQLVNAKIGYETERFDIYVYGKNLQIWLRILTQLFS